MHFLTILISLAFASSRVDTDGILILENDNMERELERHEHIMVEFYATWCGHCKAFAPHYSAA